MKIYSATLTSLIKPRSRTPASSEAFLKNINKLASRDSFAPCEPNNPRSTTAALYAGSLLPKGVFKNHGGEPSKICTRCDVLLAVNKNINEYRYKTSYFMCSHCFSNVQKGYRKTKIEKKKSIFSIDKRRAELQEQIKHLMDELSYLNEASRYP